MGEVDIAKEHPNVVRMKLLGAHLVPVTRGLKTLKEAVDSAFEAYLKDPVNSIYCIGSVVGPHPFPMMVRDFQHVVGVEAREQFLENDGRTSRCGCGLCRRRFELDGNFQRLYSGRGRKAYRRGTCGAFA